MFALVISLLCLSVLVVLLVSIQLFLRPESFITARLRTFPLELSVFLNQSSPLDVEDQVRVDSC